MRKVRPRPRPCRERGVAVVTALLLTTLAISIVASLFWQQQVQVRSMENQRLNLQTRWILRGALDYASLILDSRRYDNGGMLYTSQDQVWATPLAETRLDQYIERERVEGETFNATLSGDIVDACSRYNLRNLALDYRNVDGDQVDVFKRLLVNLQLDPSVADRIASFVSFTLPPPTVPVDNSGTNTGSTTGSTTGTTTGSSTTTTGTTSGSTPGSTSGNAVAANGTWGTPIKLLEVDDLLAVPGVTPAMVERLRPFVVVLPTRAPVNVNTAPAEVMAAAADISVSVASAMVVRRKQAPWRSYPNFVADLTSQAHGQQITGAADVKSEYFLVDSRIRLDRAALDAEALVYSPLNPVVGGTQVMWVRQH